MRAVPYPPAEMPPDVQALHEDMAWEVAQHFKGFVFKRAVAPAAWFPPMLRFPQFCRVAWIYTKAGRRPAELTEEEAVIYDAAAVLANGQSLLESTYQRAVAVFNAEQTAELIYLVSGRRLNSVLLNIFDMSVSGREGGRSNG